MPSEQRIEDLTEQLKNLAKIMSETNTTVVRMEEKLNHFQTVYDMKMEQERLQSKTEFDAVYRQIDELKDFKKEHEKEHRNDDKERNRYLLGVIVSIALSVGSAIWKLL